MSTYFKGLSFFIAGLSLAIIFSYLTEKPKGKGEIPILTTGRPELCLLCHKERLQEKAHAVEMLGCSSCHLGNPFTPNKALAHRGMIRNPSDLRYIERTCGQPNCHPGDVKKVRNSLMATNHGLIVRLLKVFGEEEVLRKYPNIKVSDLYKSEKLLRESFALDYFRKLCGSCHLYLEKEKMPDFLAEKGGGCSACHLEEGGRELLAKGIHPRLSKKVPLERCVRCHNRSGRIGFTYQGLYETSQGGIYDMKWVDGRELVKIKPDVHFKAGLHCSDCHTRDEVMGDGNFYRNIAMALEVRCETCHHWNLTTEKGKRLENLEVRNGKVFLRGKFSGKLHEVKRPSERCQDRYHRRLTCSACHSHYMPQCMGCHVRFDPRDRHFDKIWARERKGLWEEYESYREIEKPVLAVKGDKIVPVTPG